jgi:hypothetical protein
VAYWHRRDITLMIEWAKAQPLFLEMSNDEKVGGSRILVEKNRGISADFASEQFDRVLDAAADVLFGGLRTGHDGATQWRLCAPHPKNPVLNSDSLTYLKVLSFQSISPSHETTDGPVDVADA